MSPAAWLEYLEAKLHARSGLVQNYLNYRDGNHSLRYATQKYRDTFAGLFGAFCDNWCNPVVEVSVERLRVEGFRYGDNQKAADTAWSWWQANNLDAGSTMAHREAITCGEAYALVAPPARQGGAPRITIEHPLQMIVETSEHDPNVRVAALKKWLSRDGYLRATVYTPKHIHRFRSAEKRTSSERMQWVRLAQDGMVANPMGVVPVVPLLNNPSMLGGGRSDLEPAVPLNDAINKLVLDMIVASEFAAYPQRVITGIEVPKDPVTGKPLPLPFETGASRLMTLAAPDAKWGAFPVADLKNYVSAIDMLLQHLAAQTRTPPHYLVGQVVNASGDALKAAETGLTEKSREKTVTFGDGWEETMRVAFLAAGQSEFAEIHDAETRWRDPENRSPAEIVDAAVKARTLAVPLEQLWADLGYTPQQIQNFTRLAGLPERPPPGATAASVPALNGSTNGATSADEQ